MVSDKLNMFITDPALTSKDWLPIRSKFELSSIKHMIDVWSSDQHNF
jgi:hypothetical protein